MRLCFFDDYRLGVVRDHAVHDVTALLGDVSDVLPQERLELLIEGWDVLRPRFADAVAEVPVRLDDLHLRAPARRPSKMIVSAARNYKEFGNPGPLPIEFFLKSPEAILDPGGTVELPPVSAKVFHHEAELGLIIGRTAHRVPASEALDYVFGYLPFVDISARGVLPIGFFNCKSYDTFAPMGPVIVTADDVPDPQNLHIELDVNNTERQRFGTDDMANSVADLIASASSVTTLRPGDVLSTGTNHQGMGALQDGDHVRMRINDWPALAFWVHDAERRSWPRGIDEEFAASTRIPRAP